VLVSRANRTGHGDLLEESDDLVYSVCVQGPDLDERGEGFGGAGVPGLLFELEGTSYALNGVSTCVLRLSPVEVIEGVTTNLGY